MMNRLTIINNKIDYPPDVVNAPSLEVAKKRIRVFAESLPV